MALSDNPFLDLPLSQIQLLQTQYIQVMTDIATGGKSYTFPGRSFSRADMAEVRKTLSLLRTAIRYATGRLHQSVQVRIDTQNEYDVANDFL